MVARDRARSLYGSLKAARYRFDSREIVDLFGRVSEERVGRMAKTISGYIQTNLPRAFEKRNGLSDYRTNPYVLMTSASVMKLNDPAVFGSFLFNSKLYMALETSFGKSIEAAFLQLYPITNSDKWDDPDEKVAEAEELAGLSREEKARRRTTSVWREIDKACVAGNKRFFTSIKSGPNTINDTQVQAMTQAIIDHHKTWAASSTERFPDVEEIDIVLGLTYGTPRTTNNKENQMLAKLLDHGFDEEDRAEKPGVLIDSETRSIRVYRCIGKDFWAFVGDPENPTKASFVFLEMLLALSKALSKGAAEADLESRINAKIKQLAGAIANLQFPRASLPEWVREDFSDDELVWFATAMSAFYDEGV